jgi:hypothetical protein
VTLIGGGFRAEIPGELAPQLLLAALEIRVSDPATDPRARTLFDTVLQAEIAGAPPPIDETPSVNVPPSFRLS